MIPAGGLSADHQRWIHPRYRFFLPVKVLGRVFRGKFVAALNALSARHLFPGSLKPLGERKPSPLSSARCFGRTGWSTPNGRSVGQHVLHYLARYTHRVAISNHRIVGFTDGKVTFLWKDYAHGASND